MRHSKTESKEVWDYRGDFKATLILLNQSVPPVLLSMKLGKINKKFAIIFTFYKNTEI